VVRDPGVAEPGDRPTVPDLVRRPVPAAWAIDVIDGDVHTRIAIPKAVVTDRGEIVYDGESAIGYNMTITSLDSGLVDSRGNAIYAYKYSDDPAWSAVASA
jgi:hypothetical protein